MSPTTKSKQRLAVKVEAMKGVMRTQTHALNAYALQIGRIKNLSNKRWIKLMQQPAKFEKLKAELAEDAQDLVKFEATLNEILVEIKSVPHKASVLSPLPTETISATLEKVLEKIPPPNVSNVPHFVSSLNTWLATWQSFNK